MELEGGEADGLNNDTWECNYELKIVIYSALVMLPSPVLGYESLSIVHANRNLTGEYPLLLRVFILSY